MKTVIYSNDKAELRVLISQLLRENPYKDQDRHALRGSLYHWWADETATKITTLLEREGIWDHVVED